MQQLTNCLLEIYSMYSSAAGTVALMSAGKYQNSQFRLIRMSALTLLLRRSLSDDEGGEVGIRRPCSAPPLISGKISAQPRPTQAVSEDRCVSGPRLEED